MTHPHDTFDTRARAAHRASLEALSPAVRAQLRRRTHLALAGEPAGHGTRVAAPRWGWIAAPALALALALAFALPWPGAEDSAPSAPVAVAPAPEMELAAPLEQDPDFYLWLASADAVALAADRP